MKYLALLLWPSLGLAAPSLPLSLDTSVQAALQGSHYLKAARLEAQAAQDRVSAARAVALPRLSLDGNYRWVKEIPEIRLSPAAPPAQFGDHHNYSLGLAVNWDIFSARGSWKQLQAAEAVAEAKRAAAAQQEQALRLRTSLAYYQTQLAAAKLRLLGQSLSLAQSQDQDLQFRLKAGSSSRIDALSASNEELERRAQFRLAQSDLSSALRELFALSGEGAQADLSLPMVDAGGQSLPARLDEASLVVDLQDAGTLLAQMEAAPARPFAGERDPRLLALKAQVEAARRQADVAAALRWPHGSVGAKQSLDYPNGPVLEQVNQTQATAAASLPLFSFGAVSAQVDEARALAEAAEERRQAAATELRRDWDKARDRLAALKAQRGLLMQRSEQARDLRDLVYKAYKIGGANFLEVQSSGLRALQAGLDLAVAETQMLIEFANLSALSEVEKP